MTTLLSEGIAAVDALLWDCYRIEVGKALDPSKPKDLLVIQRRLTKALQNAAAGKEAEALRASLATLDVNWASLSAKQVDDVVNASRNAYAAAIPAKPFGARISGILNKSAQTTAKAAKKSAVRRFGLEVTAQGLNATDKRILAQAARNPVLNIPAQVGRQGAQLAGRARMLVGQGLRQGLGREAMGALLRTHLGPLAGNLTANHWRTVGNYMTVTARTYGDLSTYAEAGIEKYTIEAVLDKATSKQCEMMHGKEFSVQAAIDNIEGATSTDPLPWLRTSGGDIWYRNSAGDKQPVATEKPGGGYKNQAPEAALQKAGIDTPPFHGNCRTTILAVL